MLQYWCDKFQHSICAKFWAFMRAKQEAVASRQILSERAI
eukprot:COSAG06_NODE_6357_length_2968_cov_20.518422_1_plen_40_part_00